MQVNEDALKELEQLSAPTVANAIELFDVRPRDQGVTTRPLLTCMTPSLGVTVGYAATLRITSHGGSDLVDNLALFPAVWRHILAQPAPRVVVVEDIDDEPGVGAYWGEVQAYIHRALGCEAVITNGAVRDLPEMEEAGLRVHAGSLAVSHTYVRIVDVGVPVQVAGLAVEPGDLLHADVHGIVNVPPDLAEKLPAAAATLAEREQVMIDRCRSGEFDVEATAAAMGLSADG